jgi:predicted dehydrogenase
MSFSRDTSYVRGDLPDYRPQFPAETSYGIGILGCGKIAKEAHLPAYRDYGLDVVGVWSRSEKTTREVRKDFPFVRSIFPSAQALLDCADIHVIDLATRREHRLEWLTAAISARKHVLAQKPLTFEPGKLGPVLDEAETHGLKIAVNQNARWAPPWRLTSLLIEEGAIGEVVGVTHLLDKPLPPLAGTHFDDIEHMLIVDYLMHWIDITRCWLNGKQVISVQAWDHRIPGQEADMKNPGSATISVRCADGASAIIRFVGDVRTQRPSCPFWIHGTEGTIRGSILGNDHVELDRDGEATRYTPKGAWFVDGFAGAMGELMTAIAEDRQPSNSAEHNQASLELMLAARRSAERSGQSVALPTCRL